MGSEFNVQGSPSLGWEGEVLISDRDGGLCEEKVTLASRVRRDSIWMTFQPSDPGLERRWGKG